jgi:signal transduction histidine kinase
MRRLHIKLYLSIIVVLVLFTIGIAVIWHIIDHRSRTLLHGAHIVLMVGAVTAGLALLAYPIARGVTARLERLRQSVRSFGSGDLGARVAVEGNDEVAALATSFNESAARIEQLVRTNQMLLANCSHELRTPLTRMRLAAERLAAGDAGANAELTRNIGELDALIGELLLSSRLDAAKRPDRIEPLDLLALAAEEAAHFDLEVTGQPVMLRGDPLLLRRLVRNLLENARLHAGGASELRVVSGERGGAQLIVEDSGPGIAAEDRERVFEPFFRRSEPPANSAISHPAPTQTTGAGLGLAIVRQIARVHGGDVQYAPREGGGSRFTVDLPGS